MSVQKVPACIFVLLVCLLGSKLGSKYLYCYQLAIQTDNAEKPNELAIEALGAGAGGWRLVPLALAG